ncbi:hypothetical protein PHYSODRAFT_302922 [Phytophthora sojae]|uniref:Cytochrome P450 n=1 Tax=Phytophthora sojae (strain P6497) TaxID=1094619 RepID=G4ZTU3_PHYSP|nr:hypothetical protein PHYSODRAFT_302922 [Phytophthora sojae]EGZ13217.1 hypothetical protein PHYSODRAFT_302922 [Phytophthora sojae]|eukprot:XP_009530646.1 hypothetical protein PHYSODRAFT_302922 [Phytophthora sojae]
MAEMLGSRLLSPTWVWKLKRFLNIGDEHKLKQACAIVHELTHRVMTTRMWHELLLAGKDTTDFSLAWILVNLNRYPDVLTKLRKEINEKLPGLVTGEIDIPTMDDLKDMPNLEAVVKESLRLHAIATTRVPNKSVTLSDGTFVPAGCTARMTSVWGEDASVYKPERWIDAETGKVKMCVGMRFALLEMRIATAVLFSRFDLKTVDDPFDVTLRRGGED